jgi:opacity protein-like surface antigen
VELGVAVAVELGLAVWVELGVAVLVQVPVDVGVAVAVMVLVKVGVSGQGVRAKDTGLDTTGPVGSSRSRLAWLTAGAGAHWAAAHQVSAPLALAVVAPGKLHQTMPG